MSSETDTLEHMACWEVKDVPRNNQIMYSKFILERQCDEWAIVSKPNDYFVVSENDESAYNDDYFSPVLAFSIVKLFFRIVKQMT